MWPFIQLMPWYKSAASKGKDARRARAHMAGISPDSTGVSLNNRHKSSMICKKLNGSLTPSQLLSGMDLSALLFL